MTTRPRRGVALVLVLWLVVILGGLGAAVLAGARTTSNLAANARASVTARFAAESGVEVARSEIEQLLVASQDSVGLGKTLNTLEATFAQRGPVTLGDARFAMAVVDPGSRLDVNAAPTANLSRLFSQFTDLGQAADIAQRIRQRIERGTSPLDAVGAQDLQAPSRMVFPIRSLEELRTLGGIDPRVLERAAPYLTIDGDGTINRQTASDTVLAASFGELRDRPSRFTVIVRGWRDGHPLTHEIQAVFAISNTSLVLVHWRERTL